MIDKQEMKKEEERLSYHRSKSSLPIEQETENKINAVDYYNNLSDADKLSFQEQIKKKKIRENYANYVQYVFGANYIMTKFHKTLCALCQWGVEKALNEGAQVRILLSTPPQVGKSKSLTETLPSWFVGKYPEHSVIITSYNATTAEKFGDRNRQKVKDYGSDIFGIQISDSQDNKTLFQIKGHEGQVLSTGIDGSLTSNPATLVIVDDPFKNGKDAESFERRNTVHETYRDSVLTRARKLGSCVIVIHTRWHEDDLIGRLAQEQGYYVFNFPTVWEKGVDKLLGRKVGETLCPELGMTVEWAERTKRELGKRVWNALYQGKPYIEGGNIIQRSDIKFYNQNSLPAKFDEIVLSCDLSFGGKKKENDPNCCVVWGRNGANHYMLKRFNKKCGFQETINLIKLFCAAYRTMRKKLIEAKANGNATIEMLNGEIGGFLPFDPKDSSKESRFKLVAPYFESGNVYLPDESVDHDIEEVVNQLLKFPSVAHDEYVDTTSQYLLDYSYKYDGGHIETNSVYKKLSTIIRGI